MKNDSLNRLCQLAAPPKDPVCNNGDWRVVETELAIELPADYKQLIDTFGQGVFVGKALYSGLLITSYLGASSPESVGKVRLRQGAEAVV
jgi:hypothetical protein